LGVTGAAGAHCCFDFFDFCVKSVWVRCEMTGSELDDETQVFSFFSVRNEERKVVTLRNSEEQNNVAGNFFRVRTQTVICE
jgi:hypothetical protein